MEPVSPAPGPAPAPGPPPAAAAPVPPVGAPAGSASPAGPAGHASAPGLAPSEALRKATHVGMGFIAFSLRFLGPFWSAVLAAAALLNNLFLLHRIGGKRMWRDAEHQAGGAAGIVLYPLTVLLLILLFYRRLEVAAAAWGILAFGDGMATVFGMAFGRRKLPWNPAKSWAGSGAYVVFGTAAAAALLTWTAPERLYSWAFALVAAGSAAVLAAALESVPQGLDDNLGVPLVAGLYLLGMVLTHNHWPAYLGRPFVDRLLLGAAINAALAGAAWAARTVDLSGVAAGFLVGTAIYAFLDWRGWLLLVAFFVIGSACTKIGYRRKAAANLAQERGGRRGARHALANAGVAVACAVFAALTAYPALFAVAFAAAFATAAADTASSEIGQLVGRRTFLITTLRPVPRGTDGAVSLEGTLAGVAAALAVGALGAAVALYPWICVLPVAGAALIGTTFESVVGATLEQRRLLDNEALNFLNTLVGALAGVGLAALVL
jgi:uncharacterized protein (TIGR00297 family)